MAKQTFSTGQVLTASQMTSLQQTAMLGGNSSVKTTSYVLVAADAGTAVAMNSTSATTITVNTGLFSAGDLVTIMNQNTGVTTITSGTATVRKASGASLALSQYQGGVLDFISASEAIFFPFDVGGGLTSPLTTKGDLWTWDTGNARLAVGTNGQVLTADSTAATGIKWATAAAGMTSLATGSLSTGSTQIGSISGSYNNLRLVVLNAKSTNASGMRISLNNSGSQIYYKLNNATYQGTIDPTATGSSYYTIGGGNSISTTANEGVIIVDINDYAQTSGYKTGRFTTIMRTSATNVVVQAEDIFFFSTSAITSIEVVATAGTWNGGTYTLYGVK